MAASNKMTSSKIIKTRLALLVVSVLFSLASFEMLAQEFVVFNKVVSSTSFPSNKADNVQNVSGSNFKFISSASTFALSTSSNDITGTLEYYNSSNIKQSISGTVKGRVGNTEALAFFNSGNTVLYFLVMPGQESNSNFVNGTNNIGYNSAGTSTAIQNLKTTQSATTSSSTTSASVVVDMASPAAVTESNTNYIVFTLTLSATRSTSTSTVSFTPSIVDVSTTSGSDYTSTIEFSTQSNFSTSTTTTPFSIDYNVNTVYMRVALKDDALPESSETFTLKTNSFSGSGSGELANGSTGAVATGTVSDDGDPYLWTGTTSSNWNTATNWNAGAVPASTDKAKIPVVATNYPALSSNNSITDLEVVSGASLSTGSSKLSVLGSLTNNGSITGTDLSGKLSMAGTSAQTISGTGSIDNLELDNNSGVTITSGSNMQTINTGLFPVNGVLTTNGNLTMNSTSSQTASVFQKTGSCTTYISGNVTLRRYIDPAGNNTFRFIGNPFNSTTKSFSTFTNLPLTNAYRYNSAFASPDPANSNGDPAWASVAGADVFDQYQGIITYITGNTPFTIESSGPVNQCDVTINISAYSNNDATKGYALISNPYMSFLDLSSNSTRTGLQNGFYVWDTSTNTTDNTSQKARQSNFNAKGKYNTVTPGQSGGANIIPPLGAFFIRVSAGAGLVNGSITFKETEKSGSNTVSNYVPFSVGKGATSNAVTTFSKPYIYNLSLKHNGADVDLYRLVFRDEATNGYDNWDLPKMLNTDLSLFSKIQNTNYSFAVDTRSTSFDAFEVPLYLSTKLDISETSFEFEWKPDGQTIEANFVLEDLISKNKYQLTNGAKITFTAGKYDRTLPRFKLLVSPKSSETQLGQKSFAYPNPFTNFLYIEPLDAMEGKALVEIIDLQGRPHYQTNIELEKNVTKYLSIPTLTTGSYILRLNDVAGKTITQKIVHQ